MKVKEVLNTKYDTCKFILQQLENKDFNHKRFESEQPKLHGKYRNLITIVNAKGKKLERLSIEAMVQLGKIAGLEITNQFAISRIKI